MPTTGSWLFWGGLYVDIPFSANFKEGAQNQYLGLTDVVLLSVKSFTNRDEALSFCGFKHETSQPSRAPPEPSSKKRSRDDAASPPPSETSTTTKKPKVDAAQKEQIIYTDGSSVSNGKRNAAAGVGVYFGPDDERYILSIQAVTHPFFFFSIFSSSHV